MAGRERPLPDPTAGFVCPGTEFLRQATNYEEIGLIGNGQCSGGEGRGGSWRWEWKARPEELWFCSILRLHDSCVSHLDFGRESSQAISNSLRGAVC